MGGAGRSGNGQGHVRSICAATDRLGDDAEGEFLGQRIELRVVHLCLLFISERMRNCMNVDIQCSDVFCCAVMRLLQRENQDERQGGGKQPVASFPPRSKML